MNIKITSNDQFIIVIIFFFVHSFRHIYLFFFSFRKSKLNTLYLTERIYGVINFICIFTLYKFRLDLVSIYKAKKLYTGVWIAVFFFISHILT